jgi:hypothetical protein
MEVLASGNLTMSGQDYQEWNADEFAWDWIAAQLSLDDYRGLCSACSACC